MMLALVEFRGKDDVTRRSVFVKGTLSMIKVLIANRSLSADRLLILICLAIF